MTQDYSTEWRAALIERDMAVRAIVEFLDALGKRDDNEHSFEVVDYDDNPGGVCRPVRPEQFPEFDMLKRVREQLEKKLKR